MSEMTDEALISYCESHCRTERALFAKKHIIRMNKLAGEMYVLPVPMNEWYSMHDEMEDMCKAALKLKASNI